MRQGGGAADDSTKARGNPWSLTVTKLTDEQLAQILRHLRRYTAAGRSKAAKDPITRAYIEAGLRLLGRELEPGGAEDEIGGQPSPFFSWVSRPRVVAELANEPAESGLPRTGNLNGIRDRWEPHRDYIADLLLVALASDHWSTEVATDEALLNDLLTGDLADAAHEIAYRDLESVTNAANALSFKLQMIAAAFAERDPVVRKALVEGYEVIGSNWSRVYQAVLDSQEAQLRPGISIEDLTNMLTATAEGLAMRMLADPDAKVRDVETRQSILGTAALAIWVACVDFFGDGMTLEEVVRVAVSNKAASKSPPSNESE